MYSHPTLQADPAEKDKFYSDLSSLLQNTCVEDKVIILGDFNARLRQDSVAWKKMFGIGWAVSSFTAYQPFWGHLMLNSISNNSV